MAAQSDSDRGNAMPPGSATSPLTSAVTADCTTASSSANRACAHAPIATM